MAKLSFNKLGLTKNQDIVNIAFNDQVIEVKQYLPVNDKLHLISNVINQSADDNNFANPIKVNVFTVLEMIDFYTNISFTEKQKEDPTKLYDLIVSNDLARMIARNIPQVELDALMSGIKDSIEAIYTYKNSVLGILESVSADYDHMNLDVNDLYNKMADPNNLSLLKDTLTKLG